MRGSRAGSDEAAAAGGRAADEKENVLHPLHPHRASQPVLPEMMDSAAPP